MKIKIVLFIESSKQNKKNQIIDLYNRAKFNKKRAFIGLFTPLTMQKDKQNQNISQQTSYKKFIGNQLLLPHLVMSKNMRVNHLLGGDSITGSVQIRERGQLAKKSKSFQKMQHISHSTLRAQTKDNLGLQNKMIGRRRSTLIDNRTTNNNNQTTIRDKKSLQRERMFKTLKIATTTTTAMMVQQQKVDRIFAGGVNSFGTTLQSVTTTNKHTSSSLHRFYKSLQTSLPTSEQNQQERNMSKSKGFGKIRMKSLSTFTTNNEQISDRNQLINSKQNHQFSGRQNNNIMQQTQQLKVNVRKQLNLLKIPDSRRPLKLSKPEQLRAIIPRQGYQYLQNPYQKQLLQARQQPFLFTTTTDHKQIQTTISRHGVMVKEFDQTRFYTTKEYQEFLKKIQTLRSIEFFRRFLSIKCFKRWKIHVFSQRFAIIRTVIKDKLASIYPLELLEIKKMFDLISSYKYIPISRESPLQYEKYFTFLHDSNYSLIKKITQEHYMTVVNLMIKPIKETIKALQNIDQNRQKVPSIYQREYKLSKAAKFIKATSQLSQKDPQQKSTNIVFDRTFQFKNQFLFIQGFLRRMFYTFTNYHIDWTQGIYQQILMKIRVTLDNYKRNRERVLGGLSNLFSLKNKQEYKYEKINVMSDSQMRLIEFVCRFQEEGEGARMTQKLAISLTPERIVDLFQQLATHLTARLSPSNILEYYRTFCIRQFRMGRTAFAFPEQQQFYLQILQSILSKIDTYISQTILSSTSTTDTNYHLSFKDQLLQIIQDNVTETKQIIDILNTLIHDVMDYFNSQNRKQSYISSYSIMEQTREKIALIPDDIHVGLFVVNILQVKNYLKDFINHQIELLTKDLPQEFRFTYNAFYQKLINFTTKINLSVWTVEDFVMSFQFKQLYEEYREDQIFKDQEKIKNILSAVNKTLPKTYQQCYVLFLRLKDMIQKIETKVQTFDLNCIKKLKFFAKEIEDLAENIWKELVRVRNRILELDSYVERENFIVEILEQLPGFQQELKSIKKSIQRLSYIQTLQIRFSLKDKLTKDFNLYEKSQSDLKILQSLLRKLLIFQKSYNLQLPKPITSINADSLLQEINTNKSQIKISERYIISYQKILAKIYELYDYYKVVLDTADQLGRLERDEVCEVLRMVVDKEKEKERQEIIDGGEKGKEKKRTQRSSQLTLVKKQQSQKEKQLQSQQTQPAASQQLSPQSTSFTTQVQPLISTLQYYRKQALTLTQTINTLLYTKYDQIHYQILKKQKKKKMEIIIRNIETDMNNITLEVCNLERLSFLNLNSTDQNLVSTLVLPNIESNGGNYDGGRMFAGSNQLNVINAKRNPSGQGMRRRKSSINSFKSIPIEDSGHEMGNSPMKKAYEINLHSGFVNLKHSIKVIDEILNQLKNIILSPFLQDEKHLLLQKIQYVGSNLEILNLLYEAQIKVQKLIEDNILTDAMKEIERDWNSHHNLLENKLSQRLTKQISFDSKLEKDVINAWYLLLRRLSNKKVSQISLCFKQESNDLQLFMFRLSSFQRIVNIKIQQKKTIFPLFYFYTNSQILKFVLMPQQFIHHVYPSCYNIQRKDKRRFGLTTIYGEQLQLDLGPEHQTLTVRGIYEEMRVAIGDMFRENLQKKPIDLWNTHYVTQKIPMQIVYVIDQLNLAQKYTSSNTVIVSPQTKQPVITSLMQQIKHISRQLNQTTEFQLMDYKHLLGELMINSRVDYRHRIEQNFVQNCWMNELLVYHIDSHDDLCYKNLSHHILVKFQLVNAMDLISLFPGSEKNFVKMCQAFSGQMSIIHIRRSQILKTLSARLMYLFIELDFETKISEDICRGIVYNFPICFLAKFQTVSYEVISKLIRWIEKIRQELVIEKMNKASILLQNRNYFSNTGQSACIFLTIASHPSRDQIPTKLKAMFRSLTPATPCYQLIFLSKLLRVDIDTASTEILDSLYIVNGYFNLYRQTIGQNPSFSFVNRLLSRLVKELMVKKESQYKQSIRDFFLQFFVNIGMQKSSIENFLNRSSSIEQITKPNIINSRQSRASRGLNKKFSFIFKFLIDPQMKKQQLDKSKSILGLINPTAKKLSLSTYQIKQKVDTFIESVKQINKGILPDIMLTRLQEIIRVIINTSNQRQKPIFLFGNFRSGKTFLIKQLITFFTKIYYRKDVLIETVHQSEISTSFTKLRDKSKRIAMLKTFLQGSSAKSHTIKQALMFLQVSSVSNQNGLLQTFLNMFDEDASTSIKQLSKAQKVQGLNRGKTGMIGDFTYVMEIKKLVAISPNIFLNTYKFYLGDHLSTVEYMTRKWSREFLSKYDIKQKDDNYYVVVNGHTQGFKLVERVFECIHTLNSGIEWIVQPVYENLVTTVLKWVDAFLCDITDVDSLFKFQDQQYLTLVRQNTRTLRGVVSHSDSQQFQFKQLSHMGNFRNIQQSNDFVAQLTQPKQLQQLFVKIVAYCTFWTLVFCSEYSTYSTIEKIVKQQYFNIVPEIVKSRQNFLYKILVVQDGVATFRFINCVNNQYLQDQLPQSSKQMHLCHSISSSQLIIQNQYMRVFNYFVNKLKTFTFNNQIGRANNLLIIGKQEGGKSAWIRNFAKQWNGDAFIRVKSHDSKWMERLIHKIVEHDYRKTPVKQSPPQSSLFQSFHPTTSNGVLIWVDNVSFYEQTSQLERYMKFLSQHRQYRHKSRQNQSIFITKQIKSLIYFTQRRYIQKEYLYENWNLSVVSVPFLEHQLEKIFAHVIGNRLEMAMIDESVLEKIRTIIHPMVNHHLTLLKFCRQSTKSSLSKWTVDIGYGKYHSILQQYFSNNRLFHPFYIHTKQDFKKRLNLSLFFTLFCCLRSKKDIEMFQNRVGNFLDLDYKQVEEYMMDEEHQGRDAMGVGSLPTIDKKEKHSANNGEKNLNKDSHKDSIAAQQTTSNESTAIARLTVKLKQSRYFKNILIYPTFFKNFQIVSYALRNKRHLLVNKKYTSRQFSFVQMVLQIQGKDWGKLDLIRSYSQLKESIGKLVENGADSKLFQQKASNIQGDKPHVHQLPPSTKQKSSRPSSHIKGIPPPTSNTKQFYLYLPYEIIKLNPSILQYIAEYMEQHRWQSDQDRQHLSSENVQSGKNVEGRLALTRVIFIIEYSIHEVNLINNYLLNEIPKLCTVLKLSSPELSEFEDIGFDIISRRCPQQPIQQLRLISKTLYTVFNQIHDQQPIDISYQKGRFISEYNFNIRNYGQFIKIIIDVYYKRLRFAELKRNSLELTLSQIDKLVRQYKVIKRNQNEYAVNKKMIISNIDSNTIWLKSAHKKLQYMKLYSVQKGIMKYKENIAVIDTEINKLTQNQRKLARASKHLLTMISRNELAQMKYIFINNFVSMKLLFECVCLALGDDIDYASMKKSFSDLNLLNRLREINLQTIPYMAVLQIKQRITQMLSEMKSFSTIGNKTIFEWLRSSVDLLITRNDMKTKLPLLEKKREDLEEELNRLIETNQIDTLEAQIREKQKQLVSDQITLRQLDEKLYHTYALLSQLDRFQEFFQLKRHCEDQVKSLQETIKDFLYYAILEGVELVYFNVYNEQEKKRVRTVFANFMKRRFGFLATKDKQETFDKFQELNNKQQNPLASHLPQSTNRSSQPHSSSSPLLTPILEPKYQYSNQVTRQFEYLNKLLSQNKQTLLIIDPYNAFVNTIKLGRQVLVMKLKKFMKRKINYLEYRLLIIWLEDDEWNVSLKQLAKNSKNERKIIEYKKVRIMLPSELNVIFIKRSICSAINKQTPLRKKTPTKLTTNFEFESSTQQHFTNNSINSSNPQPFTQLMYNFRIFHFEFSESDYYRLIKMIIIQELVKAKEHSSLEMIVNRQEVIRKSFMSVLYFFCKKTNQFSIKNTPLIRQAIAMIEMWKITLIQTRGFQFQVFEQNHQKQEIKKIYRILSKMFKLVQMYFSQSNQHLHFDYFVTTLTRGAIYGIYNFGDQKYFILQYVISMIVYSLESRNQFLSMFFMKIYSIEENICTQMESDNLTFVMGEIDRLEGFVVQKIQKGTYNYFKHLPFQNKYLQNCYTKILALQKSHNNTLTQAQINQIIQKFQNMSYFKKLVIKRILCPAIFEQQMIQSINLLSQIIIKNNDNFIKKFFRNGLLYCQCDIYYWRKNIKLKYKYEQVKLSEIIKVRDRFAGKGRVNLFVVDDFEGQSVTSTTSSNVDSDKPQQQSSSATQPTSRSLQRRKQQILILLSFQHQNSILFSHLPLPEEHNKNFKSIPFLLFLQLYCFVNIDSHELVDDKKLIGRSSGGIQRKDSLNKDEKIIENTKSKDIESSTQPQVLQPIQSTTSTSPQHVHPSNQHYLFHRIFSNKQIKRHYYTLISSRSTQQRSLAIIRLFNHLPFMLKHQKNQSKILTFYYWKFLIWYQSQQKIVFESIKEKIMKKDNSLAMRLQHFELNRDILKAINIMAPERGGRSLNQEILKVYKQHYAMVSTYLTKQPKIDYYQSDIQRNVFLNQAMQYEKTVTEMLGHVREVGNILMGKVGVDPQRVNNYFQSKKSFSLYEMNEALINLSLHRQQVNEDHALAYLNIQLIKSPANLIALFSKHSYKILILQNHQSNFNEQTENFLKRKEEFLQSGGSIKTITQDKEDVSVSQKEKSKKPQSIHHHQKKSLYYHQQRKQFTPSRNSNSNHNISNKNSVKELSMESSAKLKNNSNPIKLVQSKTINSKKELKLKLRNVVPKDVKSQKRLQGSLVIMDERLEIEKKESQGALQMEKIQQGEKTVQQVQKSKKLKNSKNQHRLSNASQNLSQRDPQNYPSQQQQEQQQEQPHVIADIFAKFLNPSPQVQKEKAPQPRKQPSSIGNITFLKPRRHKRPLLHKIYIYNQQRILFKPLQKKQQQRINATQMFRLKLFDGFELKLHYDKEQLEHNSTENNMTTLSSFSGGLKSTSDVGLNSNNSIKTLVLGERESLVGGVDDDVEKELSFSHDKTKQQDQSYEFQQQQQRHISSSSSISHLSSSSSQSKRLHLQSSAKNLSLSKSGSKFSQH